MLPITATLARWVTGSPEDQRRLATCRML